MASVFSRRIFRSLHKLGFFPRTSYDKLGKSKYSINRARIIFESNPQLKELLNSPHEILAPNNPEIWEAGGFVRIHDFIICRTYLFKDYQLFESGEEETYKARNFFSELMGQFVKTIELPDFLEALCESEEVGDKFYEYLTLREGDRGAYGMGEDSRGRLFESACDLWIWLQHGGSGQKPREGGTFEYIQVIFILRGE